MILVLGRTHCLLSTKRVTDDTESVGGAQATKKTFSGKEIPIFIAGNHLFFSVTGRPYIT